MKISNLAKARATLQRHAAAAERNVNQFTGDLMSCGSSYAAGYARGRWPEAMVVGDVDLEIPIVVVGKAISFAALTGPAAHGAHALTTGIACSYASLNGEAMGAKHRQQDAVRRGAAQPIHDRTAVGV